jgi:hypothetical protein
MVVVLRWVGGVADIGWGTRGGGGVISYTRSLDLHLAGSLPKFSVVVFSECIEALDYFVEVTNTARVGA